MLAARLHEACATACALVAALPGIWVRVHPQMQRLQLHECCQSIVRPQPVVEVVVLVKCLLLVALQPLLQDVDPVSLGGDATVILPNKLPYFPGRRRLYQWQPRIARSPPPPTQPHPSHTQPNALPKQALLHRPLILLLFLLSQLVAVACVVLLPLAQRHRLLIQSSLNGCEEWYWTQDDGFQRKQTQ